MITASTLKAQKSKELAQLAKKRGVIGWHSMRKDDLVEALLKVARKERRRKAKLASGAEAGNHKQLPGQRSKGNEGRRSGTSIALKLKRERQKKENLKNLAFAAQGHAQTERPHDDRIVTVIRDAYWLQAYWEVTKSSVQRAKVALGVEWHLARPIIRVMAVTRGDNTTSVEKRIQDIEIHSGVSNWYFTNPAPGKTLRLAIGYLVGNKFHLIAKSNEVTTTSPRDNHIDENWTDITNDVERYFALSGGFDQHTVSADLQKVMEEKGAQTVYAPAFERLDSALNISDSRFNFAVDAHLVVHGHAAPGSTVSVSGQPVQLQGDGGFAVKVELQERRQVLPVVATNRNGTQQRTTVLAIERNTKVMSPVTTDIEFS